MLTIEMYNYNPKYHYNRSAVVLTFGIIIATYNSHMDKGRTINITHT